MISSCCCAGVGSRPDRRRSACGRGRRVGVPRRRAVRAGRPSSPGPRTGSGRGRRETPSSPLVEGVRRAATSPCTTLSLISSACRRRRCASPSRVAIASLASRGWASRRYSATNASPASSSGRRAAGDHVEHAGRARRGRARRPRRSPVSRPARAGSRRCACPRGSPPEQLVRPRVAPRGSAARRRGRGSRRVRTRPGPGTGPRSVRLLRSASTRSVMSMQVPRIRTGVPSRRPSPPRRWRAGAAPRRRDGRCARSPARARRWRRPAGAAPGSARGRRGGPATGSARTTALNDCGSWP